MGSLLETKTSLYRPSSKTGDPRIWIYKLGEQAKPGDLLAITLGYKSLVVINCSKTNLVDLLDSSNPKFLKLFSSSIITMSMEANELFSMLKSVSTEGYIKTLRPGDTGVGYTLETKLGIQANNNRAPDYKGIEIKSGRQRSQRSGRTTIFSQVPNWAISQLKSSREILFFFF